MNSRKHSICEQPTITPVHSQTRAESEVVADTQGKIDQHPDELLPQLPYSLSPPRRRRAIAIFFTLIFIETCVLPLVLYYSFRLGVPHLSLQANLAIITSLVGTISGFKLASRAWNLWYKEGNSARRPIGGGKWGLDTFHVWISLALTAFFVPLTVGSSVSPASVEAISMALPCFMLVFCVPLFITGLYPGRIRVSFRVSSMPANKPLPPLTYTITEDVLAVDGGGRLAFRQAWRRRYEVSRCMRRLLRIIAIAWGLSGCVVASVLIATSWSTPMDVGYALGYGIPWIWVAVLSIWTIRFVHRQLDVERQAWQDGVREEVVLPVCEEHIDSEVAVQTCNTSEKIAPSERTCTGVTGDVNVSLVEDNIID
ncbi:hypothetical protein BC835DRAFT_1270549 [Cytidiella melzeri]|nr:hypothetical protein BC835DRAFT_1270549 [Cytidiella melzeri]